MTHKVTWLARRVIERKNLITTTNHSAPSLQEATTIMTFRHAISQELRNQITAVPMSTDMAKNRIGRDRSYVRNICFQTARDLGQRSEFASSV
jgi:hypothetical protein